MENPVSPQATFALSATVAAMSSQRRYPRVPLRAALALLVVLPAVEESSLPALAGDRTVATIPDLPATAADDGAIHISQHRVALIEALVASYHEVGLFNGMVLVAKDGVPVLEKGYGLANMEWRIPHTPDTRFDLASISKLFTAMAIALLVEDGKLSLRAPIAEYLPAHRKDVAEPVTILHLLTHTSGLAEETPCLFDQCRQHACTRDRLKTLLQRLPLSFEPGTRVAYSNPGYVLLALIIESVSKLDYGDFLEQRILKPLRMNDTTYATDWRVIENAARGYVHLRDADEYAPRVHGSWYPGAGAVYSSTGDLLKWDRALRHGTLLSRKATKRMFARRGISPFGYGWKLQDYWINGDKRTVASHEGGGPGAATIIRRYLDDDLLIVLLSNVRRSQVYEIASKIIEILVGGSPDGAATPVDDALVTLVLEGESDRAARFYAEAKADHNAWAPSAGGLNRMAYEFLRSGRIAEAIRMFEFYCSVFPDYANAYDGLAEAYLLAGRQDLAALNYGIALELNPASYNAKNMLAQLASSTHSYLATPPFGVRVRDGIDAPLRLFAHTGDAPGTPGESYIYQVAYNALRSGHTNGAQALLEFNVTAFPASSNAWGSLGEIQAHQGELRKAMMSYQKLDDLDPSNRHAPDMIHSLRDRME